MSELSEYPVVYEQKVAWGDMDAFGHVNNVMYYRYIESARIAYFDELNIFQENVNTVVASSQCRYLQPVFYPDTLKIGTRIEEMRNSAVRMVYVLWSEAQQAVVATGDAVVVCVDRENGRKTAIPENIRHNVTEMESRVGHIIN
ncbi:thioesterase family protein [Acinetobacter chinensis]|uniref:Thioesterase family protein n=1 Tax=Acinetobacter chinensis TaxID=2004650 RepID=A0ABU3WKS8_9GAMM|nr:MULTISPECIES: thioesterase family protein [Acinetobacter]AXY61861.1 acyl-CoA thioesterase [Acinetobacter sp. WCHAc010052]MDV2470442.1 thioesterase family protein [Acinetobacter chinensis]